MKKILTFLLFSVFVWMKAGALSFNASTGELTLNGTADVNRNFSDIQAEVGNGTVTKLTLTGTFNGWSGSWINQAVQETFKSTITELDLSGADFSSTTATRLQDVIDPETNRPKRNYTVSNPWSFCVFKGLKTIKWPAPDKITVIPGNAFNNCGMEEVRIPGYIEYIGQHAFESTTNDHLLKKVIFEEYPDPESGPSQVDMYLEYQAFSHTDDLFDIYINTLGDIHASNMAFPEQITYGHADPSASLSTLHFPKEKARAYANLEHELDVTTANDNALFHAWLMEHYQRAGQASNGFYEFVSSGAYSEDDPPVPSGKFLRTFSDTQYDYLVPSGVKAYIVTNIEEERVPVTDENGNPKKDEDGNLITEPTGRFYVDLKPVNVIPQNTGVILYGEATSKNSNNQPTLAMTPVNYTGPAYNESSNPKNYLVGTANDEGNPVTVTPYDVGSDGKVAYRNFFLGKFSKSTVGKKYASQREDKHYSDYPCTGHDGNKGEMVNGDFVGFWRAIESEIAAGKAYLKAPADLYTRGKGAEAIVIPQTQTDASMGGVEAYRAEYWLAGKTYLTAAQLENPFNLWQLAVWEKDWGVRQFNTTNPVFADSFGEAEFEVDGIETISQENNGENVYYNLQGQDTCRQAWA